MDFDHNRPIPACEVVTMLENIERYLLIYEDQEAWAYTKILIKAIKDGEY